MNEDIRDVAVMTAVGALVGSGFGLAFGLLIVIADRCIE